MQVGKKILANFYKNENINTEGVNDYVAQKPKAFHPLPFSPPY
jgi:hypothetical protein